jgi:Bacterial regulatory proteins, tetR family
LPVPANNRTSQALIARILGVAARLFKEQGYAATSIEQIARASGSGKQTIDRRAFNALTVRLLRAAVTSGQLRLGDPERLFRAVDGTADRLAASASVARSQRAADRNVEVAVFRCRVGSVSLRRGGMKRSRQRSQSDRISREGDGISSGSNFRRVAA